MILLQAGDFDGAYVRRVHGFSLVDGPVASRRLLDFRFLIFDFRGFALSCSGLRIPDSVFRFWCYVKRPCLLDQGGQGREFLGNAKWDAGKDSSFTYYPSPEAKYKCGWKDLTWRLLSFFACVAIVSVKR